MSFSRIFLNAVTSLRFPGSSKYWDLRYRLGGNSGAGSYGEEATYKTVFLNRCLKQFSLQSVIDFGCGDGNQIKDLVIPSYSGYDVSPVAVERCHERYRMDAGKKFNLLEKYCNETADAVLSLDVLYHLVEQDVFDIYLQRMFDAARNIVIIYAIDRDEVRKIRGAHVRHRRFTSLISDRFPEFRLVESPPRPNTLPDPSGHGASFFVFQRIV